jgi:hypothetical protein
MKPTDTHPVQGACLKSGGMVEKMALLQSMPPFIHEIGMSPINLQERAGLILESSMPTACPGFRIDAPFSTVRTAMLTV